MIQWDLFSRLSWKLRRLCRKWWNTRRFAEPLEQVQVWVGCLITISSNYEATWLIEPYVLDIWYSFMYSWMLPKTVTESAPVIFFYHFEIFRCHWRFDLKCQGVRQLDLCHFQGLSYKQPHSLLSTECWSQVMDELTHNISKVIFWSDSQSDVTVY